MARKDRNRSLRSEPLRDTRPAVFRQETVTRTVTTAPDPSRVRLAQAARDILAESPAKVLYDRETNRSPVLRRNVAPLRPSATEPKDGIVRINRDPVPNGETFGEAYDPRQVSQVTSPDVREAPTLDRRQAVEAYQRSTRVNGSQVGADRRPRDVRGVGSPAPEPRRTNRTPPAPVGNRAKPCNRRPDSRSGSSNRPFVPWSKKPC